MSGMTGFLMAVGAVSLVCFGLMMRTQNMAARRSFDNSGSDSNFGGSSSGWNLVSWFNGDTSSSGGSICSSDSGGSYSGGDSCGGGDGGGGGGGGGD